MCAAAAFPAKRVAGGNIAAGRLRVAFRPCASAPVADGIGIRLSVCS
jgi:hypothetical protein